MQGSTAHPIFITYLCFLLAGTLIGCSFALKASEKKEHKEKAEPRVVVKFAQPSCAMLLEGIVKIHEISKQEAKGIARKATFRGAISRSEREALGWLYGNRHRDFAPSESLCRANWGNQTPIQEAVEKGYADLTDCLLALKADPNDMRGGGPLIRIAAFNNRAHIVDRMLQYHPININKADDFIGTNALGAACYPAYVQVVRVLLDHRADTEIADRLGNTPLMKAVDHLNFKDSQTICDTVALLVSSDADCRKKNKQGETALDRAKKAGYEEARTILEDPMAYLRTQVPYYAAQGIGNGVHRQKGRSIFRQFEQRSFGVTHGLKKSKSTAYGAVDSSGSPVRALTGMPSRTPFSPQAITLKQQVW